MRKIIILNRNEADKIPMASQSKNGKVGITDKKAVENMFATLMAVHI